MRKRITVYRCKPGVQWLVDLHSIFIIDRDTGNQMTLKYPEAGVWELIGRGYSFDEILRMIAVIESMDQKEAEGLIKSCLNTWVRRGFFLERATND